MIPMRIPFACPTCHAGGSVEAKFAGRQARCKHCGTQFEIPSPAAVTSAEPAAINEGYALGEPVAPLAAAAVAPSSSYVGPRGNEPKAEAYEQRPKRLSAEIEDQVRRIRKQNFSWLRWVLRIGIAAVVVLAAIALLAPKGLIIAGITVVAIGLLLLFVGFGAGAYGAFCEDSLYGFLYLFIPLYTAYYLVTRWEDLWIWFACQSAGVVLIGVGTWLLEMGGLGA